MLRLKSGTYRAVAGQHYGTPKEIWGFETGSVRGRPATAAIRFLRANSELLGLRPDAGELTRKAPRVVSGLGSVHVIMQQVHARRRVHRAYVTVHIGRNGRIYLTKNRAMPQALLPKRPKSARSKRAAIRSAVAALETSDSTLATIGKVEELWYPIEDRLRLAHKVRLQRARPREEWIVYVDALNGGILDLYDNLSAARTVARVFDPNPVIALGDYRKATTATGKPRKRIPDKAYRNVYLNDLDDSGYIQGKRVTTAPTSRRRKRSADGFLFTSHGASSRTAFKEGMAYYHIDKAIRYLEALGYSGERAIFTEPVAVNVSGTRADNSWYSPGTRQLTFGTGDVDDAEDAETILHEFGHALQDAIVPDFGQSTQAAAIGEGFSDYFAASFFAARKPGRYQTSVMTWDGVTHNVGYYDPPCVRRIDESYTFEDFDDTEDAEHDNGLIWSATLWDIRRSLGRKRADTIIIESHFQLDGFTTFARAARAILDANRNLYGDRGRASLLKVFHARGIGPVQ